MSDISLLCLLPYGPSLRGKSVSLWMLRECIVFDRGRVSGVLQKVNCRKGRHVRGKIETAGP